MATAPSDFCSLCQRENIELPAVSWCTVCSTFLCNDCQKHHSRSKALKHHHTISLQIYNELPEFVKNIKIHCQEHKERLEVYCGHHESACCIECVKKDHHKCTDLKMLSEVLTHVKSSASVDQTEEELENLLLNYNRIANHLKEQTTFLNGKRMEHIKQISDMRQSINRHLDKLEKQFIQQIDKEIRNLNATYNTLFTEIDTKRNEIQQITDGHKKMTQYGTDVQTFIGLNIISKRLQKETEFIQSIRTKKELFEVNLNIQFPSTLNEVLGLDRFGDILVSRSKDPLELEIIGPAQFPVQNHSIDDVKSLLLKTFTVSDTYKPSWVTGCDLLPNGDFVIADKKEPYIKYYDNKGGRKKRIITESFKPYDVCFIDNNTIAVSFQSSSANYENILCFNTSDNKVIKKIYLGRGNKRLCFDKIMVVGVDRIGESEIIIIENSYKISKQWKTNEIGGVFTLNSMIYYTERNEGVVVCSDDSGNTKWRIKDPSSIGPRDIVVDDRGFVFVACRDSSSVIAISPDGQTCGVILGPDQGLKEQKALAFDRDNRKLMVCNLKGGEIFLYQI